MNIFVLDENPVRAAQMLCNKHIVKMPTESGQILSSVVRWYVSDPHIDFYKITHKNHPCTLWAGQSRGNFQWLLDHANAIVAEYDYRYGKPGKYDRLRTVLSNCAEFMTSVPDGGLTEFAQAMPTDIKIAGDAVSAYRQYYIAHKAKIALWNKRNPPTWWPDKENYEA